MCSEDLTAVFISAKTKENIFHLQKRFLPLSPIHTSALENDEGPFSPVNAKTFSVFKALHFEKFPVMKPFSKSPSSFSTILQWLLKTIYTQNAWMKTQIALFSPRSTRRISLLNVDVAALSSPLHFHFIFIYLLIIRFNFHLISYSDFLPVITLDFMARYGCLCFFGIWWHKYSFALKSKMVDSLSRNP